MAERMIDERLEELRTIAALNARDGTYLLSWNGEKELELIREIDRLRAIEAKLPECERLREAIKLMANSRMIIRPDSYDEQPMEYTAMIRVGVGIDQPVYLDPTTTSTAAALAGLDAMNQHKLT